MKKILIFIVLFIFMCPLTVLGEETDPSSVDYYDYSGIDELTGSESFNFEEVVNMFVNGESDKALESIGNGIVDVFFSELSSQKTVLIKILSIGVIAAVFSNLSTSFSNGNVADTGFYLTFTAILGMLVAGYALAASLVTKALEQLLELMEAIVPVYVLSLGFAAGQTTATGVYQIIVLVIVLIQKIILTVVIPMIYMYMIFGLLNNIVSGSFLTKACELIKSIVNWILKALLSVIIGLNVIQGLINPVVDKVKASALGKTAGMIPGIGNTLSSMSEIILGSGALIKNSIGMAAVVAIIIVSFAPVVKVTIMSIAYKAAGAVLEPISDKRVVNSVSGIYDSMALLGKTLLYGVVFFILTIAIVCSTTNHNLT